MIARIGPGHYEVIGAAGRYEILKVTDPDDSGYGERGWHLIIDGEWAQTYRTKGEALDDVALAEAAAVARAPEAFDAIESAGGF